MDQAMDQGSVAMPPAPPAAPPITEHAVPAYPTTAQTATIVDLTPVAPRRIGESELRVMPAGLGTTAFGRAVDAASAAAILDTFLELGGDLVDTSDSYADGAAEQILGDWMRTRHARDRMVVATKVGRGPEHPGVGAREVTEAVHASLRRLGTDRIDLLLLHVDDPAVDFEETLLAVDELILAGEVRAFGTAGHRGDRLMQARIASAQLGVAPMAAVQADYSLVARRAHEIDTARIAQLQGLGVLARSPLAGGYLAGEFRTRGALPPGPRRRALARLLRPGQPVLAVLDRIAVELDVALAVVALAWLLTRTGVVAPIVQVAAADQVVDLAAAARVRLTRRQLLELDRASEAFASA
jgi:aryl-alcohol dehydrogenase-like predicted oxidoreductase